MSAPSHHMPPLSVQSPHPPVQRHAVLVLAHKAPRQINLLTRLLTTLADAHTDVFVHLDARSAHLLPALAPLPGVRVVTHVHVTWGGFSMIRATLALIRLALDSGSYARLHLISGQCLPLWPMTHIRAHFDRLPTAQYMHCTPFPVAGLPYQGFDRILVAYPPEFRERFRSGHSRQLEAYKEAVLNDPARRRRIDHLPPLFHGSQWFSITAPFAAFVLDAVTARPELTEFFASSLIPDEMFFQTLLMASPFATACVQETGRFLNWTGAGMLPLREADLPAVLDSGQMFARKADIAVDEAAVARLAAACILRGTDRQMPTAALLAATAPLRTLDDLEQGTVWPPRISP